MSGNWELGESGEISDQITVTCFLINLFAPTWTAFTAIFHAVILFAIWYSEGEVPWSLFPSQRGGGGGFSKAGGGGGWRRKVLLPIGLEPFKLLFRRHSDEDCSLKMKFMTIKVHNLWEVKWWTGFHSRSRTDLQLFYYSFSHNFHLKMQLFVTYFGWINC